MAFRFQLAALALSILPLDFALAAPRTPEGTLLILKGEDAVNQRECRAFILEVGFDGPERRPDQWYAKVLTSYDHDGASSSAIKVKLVAGKAGALAGTAPNGQDQIALFLDPQDLDLKNIRSFNLKWLHGDHFHRNRCVKMTVITE